MLKDKRKKRKMMIYRRFFLSNVIILVIPLLMGSIVYYKSVSVIEDNARKSRMFMLNRCRSIIDNYMEDIDSSVIKMSMDGNLFNLMHMNQPQAGSSDVYHVYKTSGKLGSYNFSSTFKSQYFVYLKKCNIVFSNSLVYYDLDYYYEKVLRYKDLSYEQWYEKMLDTYHLRETIPEMDMIEVLNSSFDEKEHQYITYIQTLPIGSKNNILGAIAVLIDAEGEKGIKNLLADVDDSMAGYTYIIDADGDIITGVWGEDRSIEKFVTDFDEDSGYYFKDISGERMMVMNVRSSLNGWNYVTVLPVTEIMKEAIYIKRLIIFIILSILSIGILISVYLAGKNSKPLNEVLLELKNFFKNEANKGADDYRLLKNGVKQLINSNQILKESVYSQRIRMEMSFFERLLKGEFSDGNELVTISNHLGINLEGKLFCVVILTINKYVENVSNEILLENDINRPIIEGIIKEKIKGKGYIYTIGIEQTAIIMNFIHSDEDRYTREMEDMLGGINNELLHKYDISMNYGGGNFYADPCNIYLSFSEAKIALDYNENSDENCITWYRDIKTGKRSYYYSPELEIKLKNTVKAGKRAELEKILGSIYNENFLGRNLTDYMKYQLISDLRGTIIKVTDEIRSKFEPDKVQFKPYGTDYKTVFEEIKITLFKICEMISEKRKSNNSELFESILNYLEENYCAQDISICSIASEFKISESYLSQFFKEQTGRTLGSFLEELRIKHACKLMAGNELIKDIASTVGYNNALTFRRAFKRVMGVNPTSYKDNNA